MEQKKIFSIFDEWIKERGYKWNAKLTKKDLWKMFVEDAKKHGFDNVFKIDNFNEFKKQLDLSYIDEEGYQVSGPFKIKEITFEELEKMYEKKKKLNKKR